MSVGDSIYFAIVRVLANRPPPIKPLSSSMVYSVPLPGGGTITISSVGLMMRFVEAPIFERFWLAFMFSFPFFEAFVVFTLDPENQTPRKGKESVGQNGHQSERIAEGVTNRNGWRDLCQRSSEERQRAHEGRSIHERKRDAPRG
jgi:hypothetical protein